jgi:hypothetical protein
LTDSGAAAFAWLTEFTRQLAEGTLGEGTARTRLQVALEGDGGALRRELDDDVWLPAAVLGGVRAPAVVVVGQAARDVVSDPDVVARPSLSVAEDVYEAFDRAVAVARRAPAMLHRIRGRSTGPPRFRRVPTFRCTPSLARAERKAEL